MIPLGLNDWSSILKTHQNHILEETTKKKKANILEEEYMGNFN
jgi:hypothetical protein